MRNYVVFIAPILAALAVVGCSGDDDGGSSDTPPIVLTATFVAENPDATPEPTPRPTSAPAPERDGDGPFTGAEAEEFLEFVLLRPADIEAPDWVIQGDDVSDNADAAENDPEGAPSIERCGRLLGRIITNFPPDTAAAYLNGKPLAYFSQATMFETAGGAEDCANEAAVRFAEPGAVARVFGDLFTDPNAVVVTPVEAESIGDGSAAFSLTGQTEGGGFQVDITLLIVTFRDNAATFSVGMATPGTDAPPISELWPYVELVLGRSREYQRVP